MATVLVVTLICVLASASAAPQEARGAVSRARLIQPQIVQPGAYLQPQLIGGPLIQPSIVRNLPYARRIALQFAQPADNVIYGPGPTVAAIPADGVRALPVAARPIIRPGLVAGDGRTPAILRQTQDVGIDGSYSYGFESEDGIAVETSAGPLQQVGPEEGIQTVTGSFTYTAPDGTPITTNWVADENGFRAEGAHLPRGPINQPA